MEFTLPIKTLKDTLESLYDKYNRPECVDPDPLTFVRRYPDAADREVVGLLAALLAYGRVRQIHKSVTVVLDVLGPHPAQVVRSLDKTVQRRLEPFRHRFNTGCDIIELLQIIGRWLQRYDSFEAIFAEHTKPDAANVLEGLQHFYARFWDDYRRLFNKEPGAGMKFLLSRPDSSAKRMHLFLRWMVRRDAVDPGGWTRLSPRQLLVPVDTHILRLTRILGFHDAKTATLKTVLQITQAFAAINPDDPAKYDFALSRIGILENCTGRPGSHCSRCELIFHCMGTRASRPL